MPFILVFIGILIIMSAIQNTWRVVILEMSDTMTGENNFLYFAAGIVGLGALGYVGGKHGGTIRTFSRIFIALILVSMILSNYRNGKNFFAMFVDEIKKGTEKPVETIGAPLPAGGGGGDSGGAGGLISTGISLAGGGFF